MHTPKLPSPLLAVLTLFIQACGGESGPLAGNCANDSQCPTGSFCDPTTLGCRARDTGAPGASSYLPSQAEADGGAPAGGGAGGAGGGGASGGGSGEGGGGGTGSTSSPYSSTGHFTFGGAARGDVVVDELSVTHVLVASTSGVLRYGRCETNCSTEAGFSFVQLTDAADFRGAQLLRFNGELRIAFESKAVDVQSYLAYGSCAQNCLDAASWRLLAVTPTNTINVFGDWLALDGTGLPILTYTNYQTGPTTFGEHLAYCVGGDCSAYSNWRDIVTSPTTSGKTIGLAVHPVSGQLFWAFHTANSAFVVVSQNGQWVDATSAAVSSNVGSHFKLDATGRAWLVYAASDSSIRARHCATNCTQPASWTEVLVANNETNASDFDLAFDPQARPTIGFSRGEMEIAAYRCTANCTSSAPTFVRELIEDGFTRPSMSGIVCPTAVWHVYRTEIAVHPSGKTVAMYAAGVSGWGGSCGTYYSTTGSATLGWR